MESPSALLIWGIEVPAFRSQELRTFEALFKNVETIELDGIGHHVQEEMGPDLVPLGQAFLADSSSKTL